MSSKTVSGAPRTPLPFLGLACAVGVSSLYYNQPLLLEMGHSYGAGAGRIGFVAVATQVGYAFGLLFFVPLGDMMERRLLMMRMYAAAAVALVLVAIAPSLMWLIAASVLAGLFSSVTHVVLPIAPDMVEDSERGRAIGIVMTGVLMGVLLARTFAGWLTKLTGWRLVFVAAAVMNAVFVPLLWKLMPKLPRKNSMGYREAMQSLWTLWRTQPLLRETCAIGGLTFAAFSAFWTTLAFLLDSHYGLGAGIAGTFGLVGAAGALSAPLAGKLADKHGTRFVVKTGIVIMSSSYLLLWAEERGHLSMALHLVLLTLGVIALDLGVQITQVANQTQNFGLVPSARSRLNTVYMTSYFCGGALGSALATLAWVHWKWDGVCVLTLSMMALAGLSHAMGRRDVRETGIPAVVVEEM